MRDTCTKCHQQVLDQEDQFESNRFGVPYCCCVTQEATRTHEVYVMCAGNRDSNVQDDGRGTCFITLCCNVETAVAFGNHLYRQVEITIEPTTRQVSSAPSVKVMEVKDIDETMRPLEEGLEKAVTHARALLEKRKGQDS